MNENKIQIEVFEYSQELNEINWETLGSVAQRAVLHATQKAGNALLLDYDDEENKFKVYTIPTHFSVPR